MSAITGVDKAKGFDGIRRYRTKVRVRIDSHTSSEPMFIGDDVVSVNTGKTTKGAGQATLLLTPARNYLNIIRPNDYINIYFNIGDGEGWTRTFFGMVDKIEESYTVNQDGKPQTQYNVVCSDFHKIFDKTQIYHNPYLAGRSDFRGTGFGTLNIGGLALMTKGVKVFGSPPDIIQNLILVMLGFGTQLVLPPSYVARFKDVFRSERSEFIQNRLAESAKEQIENAGGFQKLLEQEAQKQQGTAETLVSNSGSTQSETVKSIFKKFEIGASEQQTIIHEAEAGETEKVAELLADHRLRKVLVQKEGNRVTDTDAAAVEILDAVRPDATETFLDILDIFSFVERNAIDGYADSYSVWEHQGPLISVIRTLSHEIMNELFFDLRPRVTGGSGVEDLGQLSNTPYAKIPDEIEGNVDDKGSVNGVTHIPALVMREYPFSVIDGIDLRGVSTQLAPDTELGIMYFGAIFSTRPNEPGRHVIQFPSINPVEKFNNKSPTLATKHIDVAVIEEEEIVKSTLARTDHDHFNLMDFWSDALTGKEQKFYMSDILPTVAPINIMRHGLRARTLNTRFARFSLGVAKQNQETPTEEEAPTEEDDAPEEEFEESADLGSPVAGSESITRLSPYGFIPRTNYGYRHREIKQSLSSDTGLPEGTKFWGFHEGVDIFPKDDSVDPSSINITAIADGKVMAAFPGTSNLGKFVIIKHEKLGNKFSVYAHLSEINVGPGAGKSGVSKNARKQFAAPGFIGGTSSKLPIQVKKGDVIGVMGKTGSANREHLHLEITTRAFPKSYNQTPSYFFSDPGPFTNVETNVGTKFSEDTFFDSTSPPPDTSAFSEDPVAFFDSHGVDLFALINDTPPSSATIAEDEDTSVSEDEADSQKPKEDVLEEEGKESSEAPEKKTSTTGAVDSPMTRRHVIRWGLLHDHWFQHNLEYVSGTIEMRGAPEIRVGYRLDIVGRNMSFYVESVNHNWQFPNKMVTTLQVTRGQRNDPYPMYVKPPLEPFEATETQRRTSSSRLATYFMIPDPVSVRRSLVLREPGNNVSEAGVNIGIKTSERLNFTDSTYMANKYNEAVILEASTQDELQAGSISVDRVRISGDLNSELLKERLLSEIEAGQSESSTESTTGVEGTNFDGSSESKFFDLIDDIVENPGG